MVSLSESVETNSWAPIVYVGWKAAARRTRRCLETINGRPLIRHVVDRLHRGLGRSITVVHHEDAAASELRRALEGQADLFVSTSCNMSAALQECVESHRRVENLAVFAEHAPFPDCVTARRMIEDHCGRDADCTVGLQQAAGVLPIVLHTRALELLAPSEASRPDWSSDPFVRAVDILATRAGRPDHWLVSAFVDHALAALHLPPRLVVSDGRTRDATAAVLKRPEADSMDARAAVLFKNVWSEALCRRLPIVTRDRLVGTSRVLLVSTRDAFGGGEISLFELIRHLCRTKFEPILLVQFDCMLAEKSRALGVHVHVADFNLIAMGPQTTQFFADLLDEEQIDLVHLDNHIPAALSPALVLAAKDRGLPVIAHARLRLLPGLSLPEITQHYDRVVAPSRYIAESLSTTLLPPGRIVQIYDGVDVHTLDPARYDRAVLREGLGISADAPVITMVAAINEQKRQQMLIEALGALRRTHPRAIALIVGEADNVERPYLQQLHTKVHQLGLEEAVIFLGFESEIGNIYAVSDVLVMCMADEGWGRSTVEAMAMGVPVVVPRSGGATEILSDEGGGLLFEPDDVVDLERQVRAVLNDEALRRQLSAAGPRTASRYSCEANVDAIVAMYDELAVESGQRSAPGPRIAVRR